MVFGMMAFSEHMEILIITSLDLERGCSALSR
jgi:hypothetical protein